ncbi:MAG: sulfotransferase domain-containing protein [Candidatus Doudnabacteria bacterium]|nr:sulfotransferase domain-containing protein [bacterium]MDZ4244069.1 sulfotransferase domain-containing protein [Candidatus Doudnabacteria bacterium]
MSKSKGPDFLIVGLERSGTSWVSALLNSHPEIACIPPMPFRKESGEFREIGEIHLFNTLASLEVGTTDKFTRPVANYKTTDIKIFADFADLEGKIPKEELYNTFIERYNELCESYRKGKKLVGESTPAYVFHLNFIDRFYPGIKKLCIIRDPKDKVVSWHFNLVRKGRKQEDEKISDEFIKEYCETRIAKEYQALLDYQGQIHCFTYEALTHNPRKVVSGVLRHLEVNDDIALTDQMVKEASFENLTAKDSGRGRQQGEQSLKSHFRKGIIGDWKTHLTNTQIHYIEGETLQLRKEVFEKYRVDPIE